MKKMLKVGLIAALFSVLAVLSHPYISLAKEAKAAVLDPKRDLSVSFSSKHGAPDPGYVIGRVTNRSGNTYPCVHLKFKLSTRFDMRRGGEQGRHLGFLSTEVKNIQPRSTVDYEVKLPYPAGFGLESVSVCREGPPGIERPKFPDAPNIISFKVEPQKIHKGESVTFHWQTSND